MGRNIKCLFIGNYIECIKPTKKELIELIFEEKEELEDQVFLPYQGLEDSQVLLLSEKAIEGIGKYYDLFDEHVIELSELTNVEDKEAEILNSQLIQELKSLVPDLEFKVRKGIVNFWDED